MWQTSHDLVPELAQLFYWSKQFIETRQIQSVENQNPSMSEGVWPFLQSIKGVALSEVINRVK